MSKSLYFAKFLVFLVLFAAERSAASSSFRKQPRGHHWEEERAVETTTTNGRNLGVFSSLWNGGSRLVGLVRKVTGCGTEEDTGTESPTPAPSVVLATSPTPVPNMAPAAPTGQPVTFFVDYRARFKRIVDGGCESPTTETILAVCDKGSLEVDVGKTSAEIGCAPSFDYGSGGQYTVCSLNCTSTDCDDLYIDRDAVHIFNVWQTNENYAEIHFRCAGADENSVDALYMIAGSDTTGATGSCVADGDGSGKNLLLGELNVECPTEEGDEREYVNSHAFSECGPLDAIPLNVDGNYTCVAGDWCGDEACQVEYKDVFVEADHHQFQQCIQTDPAGHSVPLPIVTVDDVLMPEPGQYSSQFQVGAEFWFDEDSCEAENTGVRITCIDGAIGIIATATGVLCETVSSSEVVCTETNGTVGGSVGFAEYECTSTDVVPATQVEYSTTEVACTSSSPLQATRFIDLGVLCGVPGSQEYFASDLFFECGQQNEYTIRASDGRLTCFEQVQVPANRNNDPVTIPPARAFTDYRWAFFSSGIC
ncbi:expressed unknown protein [Seminavis robusta]|uniref:Uncharacterized protein n=1 Tax=Seminavis robusta TaxID=568900 RepID=A0A9N8EKJ4_9STRA|nr:expressed unknown protein [Seminavis robusta]|eukprot:Sro1134_g244950.1 n/a (536) ;mRNA; r:27301-28980